MKKEKNAVAHWVRFFQDPEIYFCLCLWWIIPEGVQWRQPFVGRGTYFHNPEWCIEDVLFGQPCFRPWVSEKFQAKYKTHVSVTRTDKKQNSPKRNTHPCFQMLTFEIVLLHIFANECGVLLIQTTTMLLFFTIYVLLHFLPFVTRKLEKDEKKPQQTNKKHIGKDSTGIKHKGKTKYITCA